MTRAVAINTLNPAEVIVLNEGDNPAVKLATLDVAHDFVPIDDTNAIRKTYISLRLTARGTISGSVAAGGQVTVSGQTWSVTPEEVEILLATIEAESPDPVAIPGVIGTTGLTYTWPDPMPAVLQGKQVVGRMRGKNAKGQWTLLESTTNSLLIPPAVSLDIPDGNWNPTEPATGLPRRTQVDITGYTLPGGKELRVYKGDQPGGSTAFIAQASALMTNSGGGAFTWVSTSQAAVGTAAARTRVYVVVYLTDIGGGSPVPVTTVKYHDVSSVPAAPVLSAVTASTTVTGEVSVDPSDTPPSNSGDALTGYEVQFGSGAYIALSGGTAVTPRTVSAPGVDPIGTRLYAVNRNGRSLPSNSITVTPPVIVGGVNTLAPELKGIPYAGGAFEHDFGDWTGTGALTATYEKSDNGTTGWTAEVMSTPYIFNASLAGKYVRVKVVQTGGGTAYSNVMGPLGLAYDNVLNFVGTNNVDVAVTPPFIGGGLKDGLGIWMMGVAYYDGTTFSGTIMSLGDPTTDPRYIALGVNSANLGWSSSGTIGPAAAPTTGPGWYVVTAWFRTPGASLTATFYRASDDPVSGSIAQNVDITDSRFNTLRLGKRASNGTASELGVPAHSFCWGRGNPAALHDWVWNDGVIRDPRDYPGYSGSLTLAEFIPGFRVGAKAPADVSDFAGINNTLAAASITGTINFTARKPGIVKQQGDLPVLPGAYIYPKYSHTARVFTIQCGDAKPSPNAMAAPAWGTGIAYSVGDKVKQGGLTYVSQTAHTSGTFSTDLAALRWKVFTINSLTHAGWPVGSMAHPAGSTSQGAITHTEGLFTCTTPGIVTANITYGGATLNVTCEIVAFAGMPADPQFAADYDLNGIVAAIEPYPTVPATAASVATLAAVQAALDALGAGSQLTLPDIVDAGTINFNRNYGGAVVVAKNRHGPQFGLCRMDGAQNLTVRGLLATSGFRTGTSTANYKVHNLWIDHCRGGSFWLDGKGAANAECRITNWTPLASGMAGQNCFKNFKKVYFERSVLYNALDGSGDNLRIDLCEMRSMQRILNAKNGVLIGGSHPDLMQWVGHFGTGFASGMIEYIVFVDTRLAGEEGTQGIVTENITTARDFYMDQCVIIAPSVQTFTLPTPYQNVGLENCFFVNSLVIGSGPQSNSMTVKNVVAGSMGNSGSTVLPDSTKGIESGTVIMSKAPVISPSTIYRDFNLYSDSWRKVAVMNPGYEQTGPWKMLNEIEAKRIEKGLDLMRGRQIENAQVTLRTFRRLTMPATKRDVKTTPAGPNVAGNGTGAGSSTSTTRRVPKKSPHHSSHQMSPG